MKFPASIVFGAAVLSGPDMLGMASGDGAEVNAGADAGAGVGADDDGACAAA